MRPPMFNAPCAWARATTWQSLSQAANYARALRAWSARGGKRQTLGWVFEAEGKRGVQAPGLHLPSACDDDQGRLIILADLVTPSIVTPRSVDQIRTLEEIEKRCVECARLVNVCAMAGVGDDDFLGSRDLGGHIVGRSDERRIVGPDDDHGRDFDRRQAFDDAGIALGEHAARGAREPVGVTVSRKTDFGAGAAKVAKTLRLKALRPTNGVGVPSIPRLIVLVSRTGVDDQQRAGSFWVRGVKGQAHVAAQR